MRRLDIWELAGAPGPKAPGRGAAAPLDDAQAWIRAHRVEREPWQRADETVENLRRAEPPPSGLAVAGGAAVVRVDGPRVLILQLGAEDTAAATALLEAARGLGATVSWLNLPETSPAAASLEALGGHATLHQHEMVLAL